MTSITRLMGRSVVTALAAAIAGCAATLAVSSYMPRGADLARYRTYNWVAAQPDSTGDPRLDSNPFFEGRVRMAIEQQLLVRGLERTAHTPDLLVHFHTSITQEIVITPAERTGPMVVDAVRREVFEPGTLLIDLVDPRTDTLVWRGWAKTEIGSVIDNQQWLEHTIDTTVARILQKLPLRARAN
jgi:hypothetical protein